MPTIHDLKQSRFLQKHEVTKPVLVTIKGYRQENVAPEGQTPERKWVLEFEEPVKPMVMNATKGGAIAAITGQEDFEGWLGARIVLFLDPTIQMHGKAVGGIGVRAPKLNVPASVTRPAPAPVPKARIPQPVPQVEDVGAEEDEVPF